MVRSIILHIGLPKCGSTFLQKMVFPKIENYHFFGKGSELANAVKGINPFPSISADKIFISDESISGELLLSQEEVLLRVSALREAFPTADLKIIVFNREKASLLRSLHKEWVAWGQLAVDEETFLSNVSEHRYPSSILNLDMLDLPKFRSKILKNALANDLRILSYEEFLHDNHSFLQSFFADFGIEFNHRINSVKVRKSMSGLGMKYLLLVNRLNKGRFVDGFLHSQKALHFNYRLARFLEWL